MLFRSTLNEAFDKICLDVSNWLVAFDSLDELLLKMGNERRSSSGVYKGVADKLSGAICRVRYNKLKTKTAAVFSTETRTGAGDFTTPDE